MTAIDHRFGSAVLWLATLAALLAVIGWETDWGRKVKPETTLPAATAQPVAVALLPEYKLNGGPEARRETVERPAFVPTRRPPPPPPEKEAPRPRIQRGQFVLTGTAVVDQQAIAFLREASTGRSRSVRKGDTINGLTVAEVAPDRVVLALGDETEPLSLKVAAGPRTTVQPAVPAVAVPGAAPVPGQPVAAAPASATPGGDPDAQTLLERRRAARAAQAAAEAAARAAGTPSAPVPPKPNPQGAAAGVPDPGWAEVYRRMQEAQRR